MTMHGPIPEFEPWSSRVPRPLGSATRQELWLFIALNKQYILMSHPKFIHQVDTRLGGECHARFEKSICVTFVKIRTFVCCPPRQEIFHEFVTLDTGRERAIVDSHTFDSDSMTNSMCEGFAVTRLGDDLAGSNIDTCGCVVFFHPMD
jgi:hypothetical protein